MTNKEFLALALNLHTRTVVPLIDRALEERDQAKRTELLALARDAILEFKSDMKPIIGAIDTAP